MRQKDYNNRIDRLDEEVNTILNQLDLEDVMSEGYSTGARNLKLVQEAKQLEIQNKVEDLNGKIPVWAVTLGSTMFGAAVALLFGRKVLQIDQEGGVINPNAITVFDKVVRKF